MPLIVNVSFITSTMSASAIGLYAQNEAGDFVFPSASAPNAIVLEKDEFIVLIEFDLV
jgi:hypothetical protein